MERVGEDVEVIAFIGICGDLASVVSRAAGHDLDGLVVAVFFATIYVLKSGTFISFLNISLWVSFALFQGKTVMDSIELLHLILQVLNPLRLLNV